MTNPTCEVTEIQRLEFAEGEDHTLEDHVMTCDYCQDFLAGLWAGQLQTDLTGPVMKVVGLEEFIIAVLKEGTGILARLGQALKVYGMGRSEK